MRYNVEDSAKVPGTFLTVGDLTFAEACERGYVECAFCGSPFVECADGNWTCGDGCGVVYIVGMWSGVRRGSVVKPTIGILSGCAYDVVGMDDDGKIVCENAQLRGDARRWTQSPEDMQRDIERGYLNVIRY